MARFILLARPTGRTGRIKGDPCGVFPDSHIFGEREDKTVWIANGNDEADWSNTFYVLDVPTVTLEDGRRMMQQHKRPAIPGDLEFLAKDDADKFVILGRHRWNFDIDSLLPAAARENMASIGKISITKSTLNRFTVDRSGLDDKLITANPVDI